MIRNPLHRQIIKRRDLDADDVNITYHDGTVLADAFSVIPVFYGNTTNYPDVLTQFYAQLLGDGLFDSTMNEYTTSDVTAGSGLLSGTVLYPADADSLDFDDIDDILSDVISSYIDDSLYSNTLFFPIHFPADVTITDKEGGMKSCDDFCGYHDFTTGIIPTQPNATVYYAIIQNCFGICPGTTPLSTMTRQITALLPDVITDPMFDGYYDDSKVTTDEDDGNDKWEVSDVCEDQGVNLFSLQGSLTAGYSVTTEVSLFWSLKSSKCVGVGVKAASGA
ncbi:hypothetical protein HDU76_013449 [Blyttiomyces sp. JEL0837]|nr:hypothetical protein HDU76_013449 [Blyttiomyces sp. JEL0837]